MQYQSFRIMTIHKYLTEYTSPIGKMLLASNEEYLTGAWFEGQRYLPDASSCILSRHQPIFIKACSWLDSYFCGQCPSAFTRLMPHGTPFQQHVWHLLQQIPYGETTTYGKLALQMAQQTGKRHTAAQAIGRAVGYNPISIFIPCHRVIGTAHNLTGYAGGIDKKEALLKLEGAKY